MLYNFKMRNKGIFALIVFFTFLLAGPITTFAATTPSLGAAATYAVLGSTYTNTSVTTINGDVGFTTPPATAPLGTHTNYGSGAPYATAGIDQASALSTLNSAPCDFTFGSATDLSLLSQPLVPGVYCVTGAQSIGTGGITLISSSTYIFRSTGALTTVANSSVVGGSACNVFWTPTATTLGANSTFIGTDIDPAGITVGAVTNWIGRALAFGGTVTTDTDAVTAPTCAGPSPITATLHVIKNVVNASGGTATSSDFSLHVMLSGVDVVGSPAPGTTTPGTLYTLSPNTYIVSENANAAYSAAFSGDCNASGSVTLAAGDNKMCTITNTDMSSTTPPVNLHVIKVVVNGNGGTSVPADFSIHVKSATSTLDVAGSPMAGTSTPGRLYPLSPGTYVVSEDANTSYAQSFSGICDATGTIALVSGDEMCTITNTHIAPVSTSASPVSGGESSGGGRSGSSIAPHLPVITTAVGGQVLGASTTTVAFVPSLPNTGFPPEERGTSCTI